MKYLLRAYVLNVFGLWLVSQLLPSLLISGGWQGLLSAAVVFTILTVVIKPILGILFLPINMITFGLLSWVIHVIVLYLLTLFASNVTVSSWGFPGVSQFGFVVPPIHFSVAVSLIITSLALTLATNMLQRITED